MAPSTPPSHLLMNLLTLSILLLSLLQQLGPGSIFSFGGPRPLSRFEPKAGARVVGALVGVTTGIVLGGDLGVVRAAANGGKVEFEVGEEEEEEEYEDDEDEDEDD